jgi:hypothetical protein
VTYTLKCTPLILCTPALAMLSGSALATTEGLHMRSVRSNPLVVSGVGHGEASRRLSSVEIGTYQRRHFTQQQGCVDPNYVQPQPPTVDVCAQLFGNNTAQEFCSDPYFGGKPECCFDVQVCSTQVSLAVHVTSRYTQGCVNCVQT